MAKSPEKSTGVVSVRVFDAATEAEIESERIGFTKINDREHYGRQFVTVAFPAVGQHAFNGVEHQNVAILNEDGTFEVQPGYKLEVVRG